MTLALHEVRALVLDVDGVLTDGVLVYGAEGEVDKRFHVRDGLGIRRLLDAGIPVALITGRDAPGLRKRAAELGITEAHFGCHDKARALADVCAALDVPAEAVAAMGDDTPDLPMLRASALAIAPADAHPGVRAEAHWVTRAGGGRGAVREVADAVLSSREGGAFHVVIPARYASTRLPGKPLLDLAGTPMVLRCAERAQAAGAKRVIVATDDTRIVDAATGAGVEALLTDAAHPSGTDRLAEVASKAGWSPDEVVVNLQGDEPLVPPELLATLARDLHRAPDAALTTAAAPIRSPGELFDPNAVKVTVDGHGFALSFSRAPMPWVRDHFEPREVPSALPEGVPFWRHVGLYAYRVRTLTALAASPESPLERAERLEQMRALETGMRIFVRRLPAAPPAGVDTVEDAERVRALLAEPS